MSQLLPESLPPTLPVPSAWGTSVSVVQISESPFASHNFSLRVLTDTH